MLYNSLYFIIIFFSMIAFSCFLLPRHLFKKYKIYIFLSLIILGGLYLRLLPIRNYISGPEASREGVILQSDANGYHKMALIFYNQGIKGIFDARNEIYKSPEIPYLTAFRTPIYPYFISLVYKFRGVDPLLVLLIQIGLNLLTIFLIFEIAVAVFKNNYLALLAAFLFAINPLAIMYSGSMYAESFFVFFFTLTIFSFVRACQQEKLNRFMMAGLLLGITTLIKPITLYFLPVLFAGLFFTRPPYVKTWKKYLIKCFVITIFFFIVLTPWQLRNLALFNHYSISFQQGRELLVWRVGTCMAWTQNLSKSEVWSSLQKPYRGINNIFERSQAEQEQALSYIYHNPSQYLNCSLKGMKEFLVTKDISSDVGLDNKFEKLQNSVSLASNYFRSFNVDKKVAKDMSKVYADLLLVRYLIIIIGLVFLLQDKKVRGFVIFSCLSIAYFMLVAGVDGYFRYRYLVEPIIILLTAASIWAIFDYFKKCLVKIRLSNKKTE